MDFKPIENDYKCVDVSVYPNYSFGSICLTSKSKDAIFKFFPQETALDASDLREIANKLDEMNSNR